MSVWTNAKRAAIRIVMPPITAIRLRSWPGRLISNPTWNTG